METTSDAEMLMNAIVALITPDLYDIGLAAIEKLKNDRPLHKWHNNGMLWKSVFSGVEVISNCKTPAHQDPHAAPQAYKLLVSAGTHTEAHLSLPDIQTRLQYLPGTVVGICGRVLRHEVADWTGGKRICIAHFMRDWVHNRLNLRRPGWVNCDQYVKLMNNGFAERQGLVG